MDKFIFQIQRFDGEKKWLQRYELPYEPGKTVLWALTTIKDDLDPTLNFTSACRHAICGSCGIKVNGHSFLSCKTSLDELVETFKTKTLTFEPMGNFDVVRDLVIDWKPKMEKMKKVNPWLSPANHGSKSNGFIQSKEEADAIAKPTDCILCGACASECNQLDVNDGSYLDPFIFNKAYRFLVDSRDNAPDARLKPVVENGLWKCLHCNECVTQCPKGIPLTDQIAYLRQRSMESGERNNQGARHAYAFHDDVRSKGRLNEMMLPVKTDGVVKTVTKKIPFAYRMIAKGKINPFHFPKKIDGIEGVRKIYSENEKERV
ncbi:succinate dehydrogenase/fumarate reductase iron-sulfur subunit [Salipaludibacillus agaradhaerens]|uniref:succinate dehydrogenase n=1 Tax=Salipaludibacillus agaradhaerens TaxID=76935 RepID=A0A9Q4B413_SALAG|nr:succinate dehydrogenase/fumarate reductase iron-sulfur subunit [Salipaludibacillus agaradhaerens]MCR6097929.1 succinate dehydrogenase/fumarate reductase iron-sulfur subunit [Salipaludibacillus agaradhaerens]MCR6116442.1 succinate dehydrogenase/fumarate reductase iron-sulfur subunit [Salipaludibacillus agaradhaerens]